MFVRRWGGWEAGLPALQTIAPARIDTLDRYGLHHLAAHLEAAGREDNLHHLMRLEWSDHQREQTRARFENTWYTVHERVGETWGYLSYLNDVDRAWQLAERVYAGRRPSVAIGLQCRYALIVTSLNSLAENIAPPLLAALVQKETGVWPAIRGLAYARQVQDHGRRSESLAAVAPYLNPAERDQALREALEAARAIEDEESRSRVLAALAPRLTEPWLRKALEATWAIGNEGYRSRALAALAPHLTELMLRKALKAARAIRYEGSRALAALAPHLTEPLLREALEAARAIGDEWDRSQALAALAPRLAELGHPAEALEAARAIGDEWDRSEALTALAPHLTEPWLREALEAARAIRYEGSRSRALAALAPRWWSSATRPRRWRRYGPSETRSPGPGRWPRWPRA